jgi:hypothetical protein
MATVVDRPSNVNRDSPKLDQQNSRQSSTSPSTTSNGVVPHSETISSSSSSSSSSSAVSPKRIKPRNPRHVYDYKKSKSSNSGSDDDDDTSYVVQSDGEDTDSTDECPIPNSHRTGTKQRHRNRKIDDNKYHNNKNSSSGADNSNFDQHGPVHRVAKSRKITCYYQSIHGTIQVHTGHIPAPITKIGKEFICADNVTSICKCSAAHTNCIDYMLKRRHRSDGPLTIDCGICAQRYQRSLSVLQNENLRKFVLAISILTLIFVIPMYVVKAFGSFPERDHMKKLLIAECEFAHTSHVCPENSSAIIAAQVDRTTYWGLGWVHVLYSGFSSLILYCIYNIGKWIFYKCCCIGKKYD